MLLNTRFSQTTQAFSARLLLRNCEEDMKIPENPMILFDRNLLQKFAGRIQFARQSLHQIA